MKSSDGKNPRRRLGTWDFNLKIGYEILKNRLWDPENRLWNPENRLWDPENRLRNPKNRLRETAKREPGSQVPGFFPSLGGGSNWPPPLYKIFRCRATAADRVAIFGDFFCWSIAHLLKQILRKSDHRARGHVTFRRCMSAQNLTKTCIFHTFVCKTTDYINCSKTQLL